MLKWLDRVNSTVITTTDLTRVIEEVQTSASRTGSARSVDLESWLVPRTHLMAVSQIFPGDHLKVEAVIFRMQALARLVAGLDEAGVIFLKRPDGSLNVTDPMLAAVATLPLFEQEGEVGFQLGDFLERLKEPAAGRR